MEPPDAFHLRAAQGWLELGNVAEAMFEIEGLSPDLQSDPEVLKLRLECHAHRKQWAEALELAAALIQNHPEDPLGWFHRSYCLHELKRTEEARDNLLRVVDKFPAATMRYNLACYECQLGRLDQARSWLRKAMDMGDIERIRRTALEDRDLQPLWAEIRQWGLPSHH